MRPPAPPEPAPQDPQQDALQDALARLLAEVGRLAVARGLPYAAAEDMLKLAFVRAASAAHPELLPHRKVSRISTATGINRREVTRLVETARTPGWERAAPSRSQASELFRIWRSDPPYCNAQGQACVLPRVGAKPSFESLAHEITHDVHPRSLLDELVRLRIAQWDIDSDTVTLLADAFVPRGDEARMLGFLSANVGDHLQAAVDNVLGQAGPGNAPHFEQALFADGLSAESVAALRPVVATQWAALRAALVPTLEAMLAQDNQRPPSDCAGRVRIGLYGFGLAPEPKDSP